MCFQLHQRPIFLVTTLKKISSPVQPKKKDSGLPKKHLGFLIFYSYHITTL
jgi:hypothetical protein